MSIAIKLTDSYAIVPLDGTNTTIVGLTTTVNNNSSAITDLQYSIAGINTTISTIMGEINLDATTLQTVVNQTRYITAGTDENGYPATFITRCNVWVQDGSGSTSDGGGALTGLGNLVIGYNEQSNSTSLCTGSHNLIVGYENSYSSYAGLVAGFYNEISAPWETVSGESNNIGSGSHSTVSGGYNNTATSTGSSVSGGTSNLSNGFASSISGGSNNVATGP